jgi:hypothetical protein
MKGALKLHSELVPIAGGLSETTLGAESRLGNLDIRVYCVSPNHFAVEVTKRAWIRAAVASFCTKEVFDSP